LVASWIWFWGFYSRHFQVFFQVFGYHLLLEMNPPHSWDGQTVPFQTSPVLGEPRGFFSESWLKIHIFYLSLVLVSFNIIYLSRYRTRHFGCSWTLICARVKHQTKTTSSCTSCSIPRRGAVETMYRSVIFHITMEHHPFFTGKSSKSMGFFRSFSIAAIAIAQV
jgi:hypothetical protein